MLDYRKLTKNGQLTLPMWFRDKYHLETGELIELLEVEEGLLIKPFKMIDKNSAVQDVIRILNAAGDKMKDMKEEEVMKLVGQEIKNIRRKDENSH
ncbi:MAG: AbrB/MazE/SpoVT family DNA-binding domain-containing protein [Proteobacteria bacterium]|nr:AbrB/MazE/SpoVT family DNA-binding domain-containing protein [Pseudomonadota bacterium]